MLIKNFVCARRMRLACSVLVLLCVAMGSMMTCAQADGSDDAIALNDAGAKKMRAGKYKSAVKDFSEALKLAPNFETGRRNRLITYCKMKNYTAAISDFEILQNTRAFDENSVYLSQMGDAYVHQGLTRQKAGNLDGAIESFDKALFCAPMTSEYLHYRGLAYKAAGETQRAEQDFELEKQSVSVKSRVR